MQKRLILSIERNRMFTFLKTTFIGKYLTTMAVSMVPVIELRGGIPFGVAVLGLSAQEALSAAVIGNLLPVPFVLLFMNKILAYLKTTKWGNKLAHKIEKKGESKKAQVLKYRSLGLCIFVAIPLPGTGAWTGALVAAMLGMSIKKAMPPIIFGVCIAAVIVTVLTYGVKALF